MAIRYEQSHGRNPDNTASPIDRHKPLQAPAQQGHEQQRSKQHRSDHGRPKRDLQERPGRAGEPGTKGVRLQGTQPG